jgi:hypothetical protein
MCKKYPIISIEDALAEDDWAGYELLTKKLGKKERQRRLRAESRDRKLSEIIPRT